MHCRPGEVQIAGRSTYIFWSSVLLRLICFVNIAGRCVGVIRIVFAARPSRTYSTEWIKRLVANPARAQLSSIFCPVPVLA